MLLELSGRYAKGFAADESLMKNDAIDAIDDTLERIMDKPVGSRPLPLTEPPMASTPLPKSRSLESIISEGITPPKSTEASESPGNGECTVSRRALTRGAKATAALFAHLGASKLSPSSGPDGTSIEGEPTRELLRVYVDALMAASAPLDLTYHVLRGFLARSCFLNVSLDHLTELYEVHHHNGFPHSLGPKIATDELPSGPMDLAALGSLMRGHPHYSVKITDILLKTTDPGEIGDEVRKLFKPTLSWEGVCFRLDWAQKKKEETFDVGGASRQATEDHG